MTAAGPTRREQAVATWKQVRAIRAICQAKGYNATLLAQEGFGCEVEQLDMHQASKLIGLLKAMPDVRFQEAVK